MTEDDNKADSLPYCDRPLGSRIVSRKPSGPGASFSAEFTVWAPGADEVFLLTASLGAIREQYNSPKDLSRIDGFRSHDDGSWTLSADILGHPGETAYRYLILRGGEEYPLADPYARTMAPFPGVRAEAEFGELHAWSVVLPDEDLELPGGWQGLERPVSDGRPGGAGDSAGTDGCATESENVHPPGNVVIYEAMVRDMTIHPSSNVAGELRGTYLGLIEKLDYIRSLGVTHIQLLPVMKAYSADEMKRSFEGDKGESDNDENAGDASGLVENVGGGNNYNWGYDPLSYFVPEGWLSSNPGEPAARVRELKTLIREAHRRGLGIILDVVYNHMARTHTLEASCPGHWFRRDSGNGFTSNSGCGNDFASEMPMARRLIHDSLRYFLEEYKVDGFRFDLMGLLDSRTVLQADEMLRSIRPDIVMLGEGWRMYNGSAGTVGMDQDRAAEDINVAMFSDEIRDLLKGGGLNEASAGFLSGLEVDRNHLLHNLLGNPQHYFTSFSPKVVVNYLVCHDGLTLRDSIVHNGGIDCSTPDGRKELICRIKAANLLLGTSQGIVFIHAGQERGRSKSRPAGVGGETIGDFIYNSYNSSDEVNAFNWNLEEGYVEVLDHLRAVLEFRCREELLQLYDHSEIQSRVQYFDTPGPFTLAYALDDGERGFLIGINLQEEGVRVPYLETLDGACNLTPVIGRVEFQDGDIVIPPMESILVEYRCS